MGNIFEKITNRLKILSGPKNSDKVTKLIVSAINDTNSCIVCSSVKDADAIKKILSENGSTVPVITFRQFINKDYNRTEIKSFYFNEIDAILKGFIHPKKIKMISFNSDKVTTL